MNNKSRLYYATLNMGVNGLTNVIRMILSFVSRTVFIYILGSTFLGLNGLLTSILTTLSLAELGIGNAIIYSLYKPVADNDWSTVKSIMNLYRKIYRILAASIFTIGLLLLPFLPYIVGENTVPNFEWYYIILLINSAVSYLFTYNRSLIIANQRNYIVSIIDFFGYFLTVVAQIFILLFLKNYTMYLIVQVIFTFLGNVILTAFVHKNYGEKFNGISIVKIPENIIIKLKKNVIGTFANKVGDVVVNGTDNILIAMFINLSAVGLYSNYQLIILSVQTILLSFSGAMTSSIGNFAATNRGKKGLSLFYKHQFMNYSLTFFSSSFLLILLPPFITLWLGKGYTFSFGITLMMVINFIINRQRNTSNVFIDAYGLAYEQRMKPFLEAIVNLGLSILFLAVFHWDIMGILLSTSVTSFFIATVYEAYVIFKYGFDEPLKYFYKHYIKILMEIGINLVIVYFVNWVMDEYVHLDNVIMLIAHLFLTTLLSAGIYYTINFRKNEFNNIKDIIVKRFKRG